VRAFECGLVQIPYDCDAPEMNPSRPPTLVLPEGFAWVWFPRRRWWHVIQGWLGGWRKIQGWQPCWAAPIVLQPGETIEMMVPLA
jgi:hypothetical protein